MCRRLAEQRACGGDKDTNIPGWDVLAEERSLAEPTNLEQTRQGGQGTGDRRCHSGQEDAQAATGAGRAPYGRMGPLSFQDSEPRVAGSNACFPRVALRTEGAGGTSRR